MNDRIRELALEADMVRILEEHASEYGNGMFENTEYPELEKFAKLLVRECADVCYQHSENAGGADTAFGYGYKDCGDDIKRIFGVV